MTATPGTSEHLSHIGLSAWFSTPIWQASGRVEALAKLLTDRRWPWPPWWASYQGVDKRDDRSSVRVGGKNGITPLVEGMKNPKLSTLLLDRARGDGNFTSVRLDLGRMNEADWGWEAPLRLLVVSRCEDLPSGRSMDEWLSLAHELVATVGALHATMGVWPTYEMALSDTGPTRILLNTPRGVLNLGVPSDFEKHIDLLTAWKKFLGRTYARHPRWGTYLNSEHVEAIGGLERIRDEVQPARIVPVGDLTYIQLTESVDTAMTPEAEERRRRLEDLMAPRRIGAPRPGSPAAPAT
jgi:hypothetical protein